MTKGLLNTSTVEAPAWRMDRRFTQFFAKQIGRGLRDGFVATALALAINQRLQIFVTYMDSQIHSISNVSQIYPLKVAKQDKSLKNVAFANISIVPDWEKSYSAEVRGKENPNAKEVAELLQRLMKAKGLGVAELVALTGIARATVHRHIKAETMPRLGQRELYAKAFGMTLVAFEAVWQKTSGGKQVFLDSSVLLHLQEIAAERRISIEQAMEDLVLDERKARLRAGRSNQR